MTNKQPTLAEVTQSLRSHGYMTGIQRTQARTDQTEEVFTDWIKARDLIERMHRHRPELFTDTRRTILDPAVGDGQLLAECLILRMEQGNDFVSSLSTLRGLDLMQDNVVLCRQRLMCGYEPMRNHLTQYIRQGDCFQDDYLFGEGPAIGHPDQHGLWEWK